MVQQMGGRVPGPYLGYPILWEVARNSDVVHGRNDRKNDRYF